MRLADFILGNIEPILAEWEGFARGIWPGVPTDPATLRDHAQDILRATALDMKSYQTPSQQSDKSKGDGAVGAVSTRVDKASVLHAVGRVRSGFDLLTLVAEYRALRGSVIRLWRDSDPTSDARDLDDLTRFNESIDQSLTEAARSYTAAVDGSRQMFLAILGHDLRNPLHAMTMAAQVITIGGESGAESSELASQILASAAAMGRMISDLLDFTSAGLGGTIPLAPATMDLGGVCWEVAQEMRTAHPTCRLSYQPHGDLTGEWDAARLRQLVSNLLGNAIQHGRESEPVEISASAAGGDVKLTIQNGGPPIPPDAIPRIFDPLVQGTATDAQKARRHGSIGLGLYIAREIVIAHGGTIEVKSSQESGTTFTVRLPRHRSHA